MADMFFVFPLQVALYDTDFRGEVSCASLFRYLEEAAMRASAHFGFTRDWYTQREQFWVIRTLQIERRCAPRYLDELKIRTWVSSMSRVRSDRNYEITRAGDGVPVARAIANWVFVDAAQRNPVRVPPEITAIFEPSEPPILPPVGKVTFDPNGSPLFEHRSRRRAQFYEADSAQHVNNTIYVDWVEQAIRDALVAMGYPLALDASTPQPWFYRHALEYLQSAVPGDEIKIRARLSGRGHTFGSWQVELVHAASNQPLVRAHTTMLWRDGQNRPASWDSERPNLSQNSSSISKSS